MTRKFASIELARLYEAQGYLKDALSMYRELDDDVLEGGAEVRAAVKRLELALLKADDTGSELPEIFPKEDPAVGILSTLEELNFEEDRLEEIGTEAGAESRNPELSVGGREEKMAELMEKWLALMVVRKRLQLFKRIRARV